MFPSEIKMLMAQDIGCKMDDMLEGAKKEVATYDGSKQALGYAHSKVSEHLKYIDKDVEEGKLDLEQAALVKKYFMQALGILQNLCTAADVQRITAQGKVAAFEASVKTMKTAHDIEKARLEASKAPVPEGAEDMLAAARSRPDGVHPGDPLAARRNGEDADVEEGGKRNGRRGKNGKR